MGYDQLHHLLHPESTQYKQFPQKKKKGQEKEAKDKGERQNEGKEKERKEMKSWRRRKRKKREEERKKREKERKKRGGRRRMKNRESSARDAPPSPGAFPSRKLGNNMTPIKGRLGKNTTPTGRDPKKLIQELQRNPSKDSRASNTHPMRTSFTHHEGQNLQKRRIQKQQNYHL